MKKKDIDELKTKSVEDLEKKQKDLKREIINDKLELKMGKVKNVHLVRNKNKDIARIETLLKMKNIMSKKESINKKSEKNKVELVKKKEQVVHATS